MTPKQHKTAEHKHKKPEWHSDSYDWEGKGKDWGYGDKKVRFLRVTLGGCIGGFGVDDCRD